MSKDLKSNSHLTGIPLGLVTNFEPRDFSELLTLGSLRTHVKNTDSWTSNICQNIWGSGLGISSVTLVPGVVAGRRSAGRICTMADALMGPEKEATWDRWGWWVQGARRPRPLIPARLVVLKGPSQNAQPSKLGKYSRAHEWDTVLLVTSTQDPTVYPILPFILKQHFSIEI